jgi:hypothetical protein
LKGHKREVGVYAAGALFAVGWWFFFSAAILSSKAGPPVDAPHEIWPVHVRFVDWLPGLFATLGMIVVNLLDKQSLQGIDGGFDNLAWRARLFLFCGFALLAGGLAGSIVRSSIQPSLSDSLGSQSSFSNTSFLNTLRKKSSIGAYAT